MSSTALLCASFSISLVLCFIFVNVISFCCFPYSSTLTFLFWAIFSVSFPSPFYCPLFLLFLSLLPSFFLKPFLASFMFLLLLRCEVLNLSCVLGFPKCQSSSTKGNWCGLALMCMKRDTGKASVTVALKYSVAREPGLHSWLDSKLIKLMASESNLQAPSSTLSALIRLQSFIWIEISLPLVSCSAPFCFG